MPAQTPRPQQLDQASQIDLAQALRKLHIPGQPLMLFNVWDAGSAAAVAASGAQAIATGSWSVASANGYPDGERMPLDGVIHNLARIISATTLPVTVDLESGYGSTADAAAATITRAIQAGAVGCNLEDSHPDTGALRSPQEQATRLRAARQATTQAGLPGYFINARCDVFMQPSQPQDEASINAVLERARAYADAGADGLFAPGLHDLALITRLVAASPLPVNIMVGQRTPPLAHLAKAGVARVSHGPGPYIRLMKLLEQAARDAASTAVNTAASTTT